MFIVNGPIVSFRPKNRGAKPYEIKAKGTVGEIFLYDVVGDPWDGTTAKQFAADLNAIGDVGTLNIYINSPGGSVFDGVAIYNVLKRHRARKVVQIDGIAASIASVIAMAGDEIQIAANGMMMIHDPWAVGMGSAKDFRKLADSLDKVREAILSSYINRSTSSADQLSKWMAEETWFTAEEAVDAGLADSMTEEVAIAAFANLDLSPFRHVPDSLKATVSAAPAESEAEQSHDGKPHTAVSIMQARVQKRGLNR